MHLNVFKHFPKLQALSYQYAHWNALQGNKLFAKSNFANAGSSSMQNFFLPKFLQQQKHISSKPNWILSPVPYLKAVERSYVVNLKYYLRHPPVEEGPPYQNSYFWVWAI